MLLIITPAMLAPPLAKLRQHKSATGMPTEVVTLEHIYQSGYPGDEAGQVKHCIADYYDHSLCRFVLLVGDVDVFPVRYTKTDRADAKAHDTAFYPTDLYYAALHRADGSFDTWDANGNGYYGELRGETGVGDINVDQVSLVPEVAVGRVPASTLVEVERFVDKCIGYETKACNCDWTSRALLIATHDWEPNASDYTLNAAQSYVRYSTTVMTTRGRYSGDRFIADAITGAFKNGVGLIGYFGHGNIGWLAIPTGWWGVSDATALTNTDRWPIVAVDACETGEFAPLPPYGPYIDEHGVNHEGSSAGEVFTSAPPQPACLQTVHDPDGDLATRLTVGTSGGAVAYFGGVTGMQRREPVEYFLQGLTQFTTVGDAWRQMLHRYYLLPDVRTSLTAPDWFAVATFHQPWKYMVFGDPSLRIHGVSAPPMAAAASAAAI